MPLKKFKPVTPGSRFRSVTAGEAITRKGPEKSLTESLSGSGGRNHHGRITTRRRGGGHKRRYRLIDFKRDKRGVPAKVLGIEYDPNRNADIVTITRRTINHAVHRRDIASPLRSGHPRRPSSQRVAHAGG